MVSREEVIRQRRAGYSALDIAKKHNCSRQYIYIVLKKMTPLKAIIKPTDAGFHISTEDNAAAATAIRRALTDAGWEVEG